MQEKELDDQASTDIVTSTRHHVTVQELVARDLKSQTQASTAELVDQGVGAVLSRLALCTLDASSHIHVNKIVKPLASDGPCHHSYACFDQLSNETYSQQLLDDKMEDAKQGRRWSPMVSKPRNSGGYAEALPARRCQEAGRSSCSSCSSCSEKAPARDVWNDCSFRACT